VKVLVRLFFKIGGSKEVKMEATVKSEESEGVFASDTILEIIAMGLL
jgi:hypothetical protein